MRGHRAISRHDRWSLHDLIAAKRGCRVSVVIPARDEGESVGAVASGLIEAWRAPRGLVDEVVVIDSDSVDDTFQVATDAGATVYRAAEIRPDLGAAQGKGEALWKALHVTTGDLLVFVDADLVDWGPHFVPGLLGPLLTEDGVHLVKAVYDRPMLDAAGAEAEAGGRVTELVARPLLALHRPHLGHLVQPLSGEWAIRRDTFERLCVPTGYGVEIAAVLDVDERHGTGAIAQVDLGRRTHRHRRHDTLGPMALQVIAAVEARLDRPTPHTPEEQITVVQFERTADGYLPRERSVSVGERPPARSVPHYRRDPHAPIPPGAGAGGGSQ